MFLLPVDEDFIVFGRLVQKLEPNGGLGAEPPGKNAFSLGFLCKKDTNKMRPQAINRTSTDNTSVFLLPVDVLLPVDEILIACGRRSSPNYPYLRPRAYIEISRKQQSYSQKLSGNIQENLGKTEKIHEFGSGSKHPCPPQLSQGVAYGCRGHLIAREW